LCKAWKRTSELMDLEKAQDTPAPAYSTNPPVAPFSPTPTIVAPEIKPEPSKWSAAIGRHNSPAKESHDADLLLAPLQLHFSSYNDRRSFDDGSSDGRRTPLSAGSTYAGSYYDRSPMTTPSQPDFIIPPPSPQFGPTYSVSSLVSLVIHTLAPT